METKKKKKKQYENEEENRETRNKKPIGWSVRPVDFSPFWYSIDNDINYFRYCKIIFREMLMFA